MQEVFLFIFDVLFRYSSIGINSWFVHYASDSFDDVREIQKSLKADGIELVKECDESTSGPESITFFDPDGNVILIDQYV